MQMQMTIRKNYRTIDWTEDLTLMTYQKEYFDYKGTPTTFQWQCFSTRHILLSHGFIFTIMIYWG